ncbi:PAS domain S-box protein [Roseospirillum parvum]|uniref:histidine kinase n=1 Tax=Roseospirillum parvum TaxID=83401 RepID=A0A1G7XSN5_9PROT|nr:PAS domain S-box protein [Roseospirillum parvum]SDG87134.1 PAS domain S-box-containing protein [Roseospirillum parvum]
MNARLGPDSGDALVYWIGRDGRILDISEPVCAFLGYPRDQLVTLSIWDINRAFPAERWLDHWASLQEARQFRFQGAHWRRDGSRCEVEVVAHWVDLGGPPHICAVVTPLTEGRKDYVTLRDSEARLALALDVSGQAPWELDLITGQAMLGQAHAALLGRGPTERLADRETWLGWVHPADQNQIVRLFEQAVSGQIKELKVDFRMRHAAGHWVWLRTIARVVQWDEMGRPSRMLGTHLDITASKRAEEALQLTQASIDRASIAIAWHDREGRIIYINEKGCRSLGYPRDELIGCRVDKFDPEFPIEDHDAAWERLKRKGLHVFESRHVTKDGRSFPVEITATHIATDEKEFSLSFVRDISERKAAEQSLRSSEAFLDSIIKQNPMPLIIFDGKGDVVRHNQAAIELFRATGAPERLEDYNLFEDDRVRGGGHLEELPKVLSEGRTIRFQNRFELRQANGNPVLELDTTLFPIRNANGDITHFALTHVDITELKAAEARLRYHLDSEQALADISALMIKPGWDDLDARLNWMLERIGELTQADRTFLFAITADGLTATNTHEWCAPGITPQILDLQDIRTADHSPFFESLRDGQAVTARADDPDYPLRFKPRLPEPGLHSLICIPVVGGNRLLGFLGLEAIKRQRAWSQIDVRFLRLVAEIVAHTQQHLQSYRAQGEHTWFLESLDRISRILTRSRRDANIMTDLTREIRDIFQADRAYLLHPCDPDAETVEVTVEAARTEYSGTLPETRVIEPNATLRAVFRQALASKGPVLTGFEPDSEDFRQYGTRSRMAIALRPEAHQPWQLGLHQCDAPRDWTGNEQRLFQTIAERIGDALSGHLLLRQLTESEGRYRAVFDNTLDAVIIHDAEGHIMAVNKSMLDIFGLDAQDIATCTVADLCGPGPYQESRLRLHLWNGVMTGDMARFEMVCRRPKDGQVFPVEVILRAIPFGDRQAILANVRDITERTRAEEALRQSEERFAKAFRANPAAMLISTIEEGRIIDVNDRWQSLFGGTRQELIGRTTTEVGVWQRSDVRAEAIEQFRRDGQVRDVPMVFFTRAGVPLDILWSAETITVGDEKVFLSLVNDLTEQKRAEHALRESEARLSAAIESIPFDFFLLDINGQYVLQNTASRRRWGDVVGRDAATATVHQGQDASWGAKLDAVRGGEIVDAELEVNVDGEELFFRNVLAPVKDGDGVRGIVELTMDITARKRTESELESYRSHLEELVSERTAALQQAMSQLMQAEKLAALGNLVAGLAHELNTPLGNARMVASTLAEHINDLAGAIERGALSRAQLMAFLETGLESVDLLERNTVRAADLISHVKEVAIDQTSVRRRVFNLLHTTEEVLSTLSPTLKRTEHRIEIDIPPNLEMDSYPGPLEQIITNLVSNSLTHGFAGIQSGLIRIEAHALDDEFIRFSHADDGVGIPPDVRTRVFDPFFTTRLGQGGSGLGLYIVYSLVTGALGGQITVTSGEGQTGTLFTLTLPRRAPERQSSQARTAQDVF